LRLSSLSVTRKKQPPPSGGCPHFAYLRTIRILILIERLTGQNMARSFADRDDATQRGPCRSQESFSYGSAPALRCK
jgi:hypothetical protein